jgi:hypothetical protein
MTSVFESLGDTGRGAPMAPTHHVPQAATHGAPEESPGGLDLSVFVALGAQLGTLTDGLQADRARRESMQPPSNEQLFKSGVVPASGVLTLDLGSVPLGRVWQVRRLIVGGVKVTTSAAGEAYAFAQGAPPTDLATTDCVDIFSSLPQGNTYGTHQLFLLASEHLWVVFSGASADQQYAASARVEDWAEAAYQSTFASE